MHTASEIATLLSTRPTAHAEYSDRDATGQHWITVRCWLDSDGVLVRSHPTDPSRGTIPAPEGVEYTIHHEHPEDVAWREDQHRLAAAGR